VNVARHLLVASTAKGGVVIEEEEFKAGLELVAADALPRPQPRAAKEAPTAGFQEGTVLSGTCATLELGCSVHRPGRDIRCYKRGTAG